jgi:hypothetical protein
MTGCRPFESLVALFVGELDEAEAESVTEHVFACDTCADLCARLAGVVHALRDTIPMVISHAHRDRLVVRGVRVRVTSVEPNLPARARFTPEVDLLVFALRGDLSHADRVDVDIVSPSGSPSYALEDVPFNRATGEVLIACQRHFEGMFPGDPTFRVHALEAGQQRAVGDFLVIHAWR